MIYSDDDKLFFDENSVTFSSDEIVILSADLNIINLGDTNFDEDDPKTIIHVRLLTFNCYLATPQRTLGHCQGDSLTHTMLTTAVLHF